MVLEDEVPEEEEKMVVEEVVIPEEGTFKKSLKPWIILYSSSLVMAQELNITQKSLSLMKYLPSSPANKGICYSMTEHMELLVLPEKMVMATTPSARSSRLIKNYNSKSGTYNPNPCLPHLHTLHLKSQHKWTMRLGHRSAK